MRCGKTLQNAETEQVYLQQNTPPVDSLRVRLASWYFPAPRPIVGTARSLIASGDLRLVRNDSLRSAITTYLERTSERLVDQGRTIDMAMRAMYELKSEIDVIEPKVLGAGREPCADQQTSALLPSLTEESRAPLPLDLGRLYANRSVYKILTQVRNVYLGLRTYRNQMRDDAEGLHAQIEAYVGD